MEGSRYHNLRAPEGLSRRALYLACPNLDWFKRSFLAIFVDYKEDSIMADVSTQAMTVRDVARYLNVNEKTVYRLARRGRLPGFKAVGA